MRLANQALGSRALSEIRRDIALRHSIQLPGSDPTLVLDLQFARDQAYVSRRGPLPTFTRASAAWRVNSAGVIVPAAINTPRLDYDPTTLTSRGLLLEEQRTNLCPRSEEFSDASWFKFNATVSANAGVSPDGATTADLIYPSSTGALTGQCYRAIASGISSGNSVTVSCFVKASGKTFAYVAPIQNSFSPAAYFNLSTGAVTNVAVGVTASMQQFPGGWWRIVATSTAAAGPYYAVVGSTDAAGSGTNTASGTNGILVWGMDVEVGASATSYIPTTSAAVVRSADVCSITGSAFSGFWNASEGTIALKLQKCNVVSVATSQANYVTANDGTLNNYILFAQRATGTVGEVFRVESGGTSQAILQAAASVVAANTRFGLAGVYKVNDVRASCNGGAVVSDITATMPALNQLQFVTVTSALWVESLQYFNRTKTNAELQALSAP